MSLTQCTAKFTCHSPTSGSYSRDRHFLCREANGYEPATVVRVTRLLVRVQCHPAASPVARANMSRRKSALLAFPKGSSSSQAIERGQLWGSDSEQCSGGPATNSLSIPHNPLKDLHVGSRVSQRSRRLTCKPCSEPHSTRMPLAFWVLLSHHGHPCPCDRQGLWAGQYNLAP
jgi:hypothetical protein